MDKRINDLTPGGRIVLSTSNGFTVAAVDDLDAIATWRATAPDPAESGPGVVYVCTECRWRDRGGMLAAAHHTATGHAVRGRDWPASWPDAQFGGAK